MWQLQADRDGHSVESGRQKGRDDPEWWDDRPEEPPGCDLFWEAFGDLKTERHPDGAIPWSACRLYIADRSLSRDVGEALWQVIKMLDSAERNWHAERFKEETESGGNDV